MDTPGCFELCVSFCLDLRVSLLHARRRVSACHVGKLALTTCVMTALLLENATAPRDHLSVNTTPYWVPLVVGVIGVLGTIIGTIGGVLITQRQSDSREAAARRHELEREQARWAREDSARTFKQRSAAYVDFYRASVAAGELITIYSLGRRRGVDEDELPNLWEATVEELFTLQIYATPRVAELAGEARELYEQTVRAVLAWRIDHDDEDGEKIDRIAERWELAVDKLLVAIRNDLGIPGDTPGTSLPKFS
ncbi:hypothetical protein [Mycobacteroides immunogenum]|uniref:hypothetical protein n=1 Tax=Mycobacteroides immunogenum TaxID=83262 RepID=UPI00103E517A|nr:hypothetical protein [Mycobacteroides immunogenum]MCV7307209.1 hypothetical protein [Mycobacteroides immunogenum]